MQKSEGDHFKALAQVVYTFLYYLNEIIMHIGEKFKAHLHSLALELRSPIVISISTYLMVSFPPN